VKKNDTQWKLEEMEVTYEDEGKVNDAEAHDTEETLIDE
jgi:hypothetical protein